MDATWRPNLLMLFFRIFYSLFISYRGNGEPRTSTYTQLSITQAQSFYIPGLRFHDNSFLFVIFKPLCYCFEEKLAFDVKASFERRPVWRLIKPGDIAKEF